MEINRYSFSFQNIKKQLILLYITLNLFITLDVNLQYCTVYSVHILPHCPKNYLNFWRNSAEVDFFVNGTCPAFVHYIYLVQIPDSLLHLLPLWKAQFLCGDIQFVFGTVHITQNLCRFLCSELCGGNLRRHRKFAKPPIHSWARDNTAATMWPCFQVTKLLIIALYLYMLFLFHLDTEPLTFSVFFLVIKASLCGRVVVVAELKKLSRTQLFLNPSKKKTPHPNPSPSPRNTHQRPTH